MLNPIKWLELELKRNVTRAILDTEKNLQNKKKREQKRLQEGRNHLIYYFHQVDDPYSHLCAQTLPLIANTYDVEIKTFLVPSPTKEAAPEPDLLKSHSLEDAKIIAPH